jgi:phage gp29-like protein
MNNPLSKSLTGGDLASRMVAFDFSVMGTLLPNPDPLLKQIGQDIRVYRQLLGDSHVGACVRRRKSAVKALESGLDRGKAPSRVAKACEAVLAGLDMERLIGQALDACLFGYAPMEINWRNGTGPQAVQTSTYDGTAPGLGSGIWPADVQLKPPEWFCFDADARLRLKTKTNPVFGDELPERKFLLPRQDPSYQNPYGFPDLSLCYWPVLFKKGGMRFWLTFAEKYGGAFAVGKLPRGADPAERSAMLDSLASMLQDAVATIPDDGSVELKEASGKAASADLYEKLVLHCRGEISIVLTGTNQTVEASANKASAHAGMDVAGDLRDADAEVVAAAVNQLLRWVVDLNWPGTPAPVWSLWDQVAQDELQALRDKSNYDAGARFTNLYWQRAYGYEEGDLAAPAAPVLPGALPGAPGAAPGAAGAVAFAQAALNPALLSDPTDPTAAQSNALATAAAPAWSKVIAQVQALVDQAQDLGQLQTALTNAYGGLETGELTKLMSAAFALAELKGIDAVRTGD